MLDGGSSSGNENSLCSYRGCIPFLYTVYGLYGLYVVATDGNDDINTNIIHMYDGT